MTSSAASVSAARKHPVLGGFPLRRQRLPVGGKIVSLVVPHAARWRRAGGIAAALATTGEPPYWMQIWPAAVAISQWLGRGPDLSGRAVLDLGCGLGLPGLIAAARGAAVTFADRQAAALAFARWNLQGSAGEQTAAFWHCDWMRLAAAPEQGARCFDMVLLADVTYRTAHHPPLLALLAKHLGPGSIVVHADPMRPASDRFMQHLSRLLPTRVRRVRTCVAGQDHEIRLTLAGPAAGAGEREAGS